MHVTIAHVTEPGNTRGAIYARQSKDRVQGINAQVSDCKALCRLRGVDVMAVIDDNDVSASSRKARPGYTRLLGMVEGGEIDVIAVSHVDRLLRKLAELEHLIELCEKHHVSVITVSGDLDLSNDAGRLVGRILAVIARGEVERKGSRQRRANLQAAEEGKPRLGAPRPFGWQADRVRADPDEAAAVLAGCIMVNAGGTLTGIARDWERRGLRPHQAPFGPLPEHPWTRTSVREILCNPRVAGIAVYKGEEKCQGQWEPLVSEETWRATVDTLRNPRWRRPTQGVTSLLGGIAFCCCGNYVTGSSSANGLPAYRCNIETRNYRPGPHVAVKREEVDKYVSLAAVGALSGPDAIHLLAPRAEGDAAALIDEEAALQSRLSRLGSLYAAGQISETDLVGGRERGERRLAEIAAQLAELGRESVLAPLVTAGDVAAKWEGLGLDLRRAVVDTLMTVTLHPSGRGARRFDPEKVLPPGQGIKWKA